MIFNLFDFWKFENTLGICILEYEFEEHDYGRAFIGLSVDRISGEIWLDLFWRIFTLKTSKE